MTRREWATLVGTICSPSFPADGVEAMVDMLPLLTDWGDDFFTGESAKDVARVRRRQAIPAFDEIEAAFSAIRRERMPLRERMGYVPALPAPEYVPQGQLSPEELGARVAALKAEFAAGHPDGDKPKSSPRHLTPLQCALGAKASGAVMRPDWEAALASLAPRASELPA